MFIHIFAALVITVSLIVLAGNQLLPTILAQEDSLTESTTGNTTESTTGNTTESTTGNTTESSEDENLQQSGTISRKSG